MEANYFVSSDDYCFSALLYRLPVRGNLRYLPSWNMVFIY